MNSPPELFVNCECCGGLCNTYDLLELDSRSKCPACVLVGKESMVAVEIANRVIYGLVVDKYPSGVLGLVLYGDGVPHKEYVAECGDVGWWSLDRQMPVKWRLMEKKDYESFSLAYLGTVGSFQNRNFAFPV